MQLVLPVQALILDIGNVICEWSPVKLGYRAHPGSGQPDASVVTEVVEATIRQSDWLDLDRGVLTPEVAIKRAQQRWPKDNDWIESIYRKMPESLVPLPDTVAAMQEARDAGLPLYILSNMPSHAGQYLFKNHACFSWVEHAVLSCDCKMLKPDLAIYHHLIKTCALVPQHCVFLDDMPENVNAAQQCQLQAFQAKDTATVGAMIRDIVAAFVQQN